MIHEIARLAVAVFYSRHSEIKVVAPRFREAVSPSVTDRHKRAGDDRLNGASFR